MYASLAVAILSGVAFAAPQGDHHPYHKEGYKDHHGYVDHHGHDSGSPTVDLQNGTVSGLYTDSYGGQDFFLGVPYAQPPVGDLRFRQAQSLNTTFDGTYAATEYPPLCVGYGGDQTGYPVSEDCLYVNIVRPSGCEGQNLPVGAWIHGGGLFMGGASDARFVATVL